MQNSNEITFGEDEEHYHTPNEIATSFDLVQKICMEYENCDMRVPYDETIKMLKKLEKSIIAHAIFSPNEDFKEIPTENIKYLLIPYYISNVFGRIQANRRSNLMISKTYLDEFVKLANYYGLVSKEQRRSWKARMENMSYEPTREEKVQGFKDQKELDKQIKNLELVKDEDSKREILKFQIESIIMKAIDEIRMIHMEMQLQEHKEKLEKAKGSGDNKLDPKPEKVGPMKVWHIPKPSLQENQSFMQSQTKAVCQHCDPLFGAKIREEMHDKVFQPGFSQPTMTLEEFGEKEYQNMMKQQAQADQMSQLKQAEDDVDSDKDEKSDKKRLEERYWDDWKDENEKGAGNKKR